MTTDQFWARVDKSGGLCWQWTGAKRGGKFNYGIVKVKGRDVRAHRMSYEMTYGPIPAGLFVCHKCDNPMCVRPDHLFIGTLQDNNRDRHQKGRTLAGANHYRSKLTPDQVAEIRRRYKPGRPASFHVKQVDTQRRLAAEFGVTKVTIARIVHGQSWR